MLNKKKFACRRWTISLFCLLLLHYFLAYHIISHLSVATRREEVSSFLFLLGVSDELAVQRISPLIGQLVVKTTERQLEGPRNSRLCSVPPPRIRILLPFAFPFSVGIFNFVNKRATLSPAPAVGRVPTWLLVLLRPSVREAESPVQLRGVYCLAPSAF